MMRARRAPAAAPTTAPAPAEPDPAGADAWIDYYRRRAEAALTPGLVPVGAGLAAARHAALRAGDFTVTEPAADP